MKIAFMLYADQLHLRAPPPPPPSLSISFLFSLPSGGENSNELDRSEFVIPSLFGLVWVANLDALYLH